MKEHLIIPILCICMFLIIFLFVHTCNNVIQDHGGTKQIIIDAGKEVKDIIKEIEKKD